MIINKADFVVKSVRDKMFNNYNTQMESMIRRNAIEESIHEQRMDRIQIENAIESIYRRGPEIVFRKIMCELYKKSLVLDDYFIQENASDIDDYMNKYLDEHGGINLIKEGKTTLHKKLLKICNEVTSIVTEKKRKSTEDNEVEKDSIDFEMDEDDEKKVEKDLSSLSVDEISELVKKKVTRVVLDEKKVAQKQEDNIREAEEQIAEDNATEEEREEARKKLDTNKEDEGMLECSFFGSLMRKAYREYLETNSTQISEEELPEQEEMKEVTFDDDEIRDSSDEPKNAKIMDTVMASAIAEYTLFELANTMKLVDYSPSQIREMSYNFAY